MAHLESKVSRVSDLISEISAATEQQSGGLTLVSSSVASLDQITQQNAALVEQSAAASENLKCQANRLAEAISAFR
jgi:methyl-accepting chemotaxis protein